MGDPDWSRDTLEGTVAHGGPRLEQEKSKKEGAGEEKSKKPGLATRNHHILPQPPVPPIASAKELAGTEHNVWSKQGERGLREVRCWHKAEPG